MSEMSASPENENSQKLREVEKNIATVVSPEGKHTILYGRHDKVQNPSEVPEDATSLMLETGGFDFVDSSTDEIIKSFHNKQYIQLIQANEARKLPIYLTDAKPRNTALILHFLSEFTPLFKFVGGAKVGFDALEIVANNKNEKSSLQRRKEFYAEHSPEYIPEELKTSMQKEFTMSRRDFMKVGGKIALGTWLATPLIVDLVQRVLYNKLHEQRNMEKIDMVNNTLHPDDKILDAIILTARNLLIAHKNQLIMERQNDSSSNMASVLGAGHYGIEEALLATPEERLASLKDMQPLLKIAFRDSTFYSYAKLIPKEQEDGGITYEKTITEVPELKELIT